MLDRYHWSGILRPEEAPDLGRARWMLADRVSRVLSGAVPEPAGLLEPRALRLEVPVGRVDPLRWLRARRGPRLYWSGREDGFEVAAAGVADLYEGDAPEDPGSLQKRLAPLLSSGDPRLRYYGGLRFDPYRKHDDDWTPFGAYRFVLPRFELRVHRGTATLGCNLVLPRDADRRLEILEEIEQLSFLQEIEDTLPAPLFREDEPGFSGWESNVERALSAFAEGSMDKVVLARRVEFGFEEDVDPVLLAKSLKTATPGCFHFYVEPEEGAAFVGASPERLFRREGRLVLSEAVAGTRPRGESAEDDAGLRDELLESLKDRAEQTYVRVGVREALGPLCEALKVEESASEMRLARGRHLVSGVRGRLREGVTDAEVLVALHPTPAVGGYPREKAVEAIRELEPFDRGWYAGAVGWIGADEAEFAVGIRSGLVTGDRLSLFSGAGIVAGSTPEGEWAEIEQKIGDFMKVFGLDPVSGHAAR